MGGTSVGGTFETLSTSSAEVRLWYYTVLVEKKAFKKLSNEDFDLSLTRVELRRNV